jgi:hypothetical protein
LRYAEQLAMYPSRRGHGHTIRPGRSPRRDGYIDVGRSRGPRPGIHRGK